MKRLLLLLVGTGFLAAARPARAEAADAAEHDTEHTDTERTDRDSRKEFWQLSMAYRSNFITDAGLDPFSENNHVPHLGFGATRTLLGRRKFTLAAGIDWAWGGKQSTIRGDKSRIFLHRLSVPVEGRIHLSPQLYTFGRIAPTALSVQTNIQSAAAPADLVKNTWLPAMDLSLGGAYLIHPSGKPKEHPVRFWVGGEVGYTVTGKTSLVLRPDLSDDDPRRTGSLDLGPLSLSGAFFRITTAITF